METGASRHIRTPAWHRFVFAPLLAATLLGGAGAVQGQEQASSGEAGLTTLITDTPEEGFALAIKLSQKAVATTQTDADVRKALRPAYAHDPNSLIAVSHVVATHFQTVAAANNYWRD